MSLVNLSLTRFAVDAVFLIPSIFCIGSRGQNLLTMNGAQTATQLKEKLNDAFCVSHCPYTMTLRCTDSSMSQCGVP